MAHTVIGSSNFSPIGAGQTAGPIGVTGATGATGATGSSATGPIGPSGGDITDMYIVGDGILHTTFTYWDGTTAAGPTASRIQGPTGNTWTLIDGGGTGWSHGGATIFKERANDNTIVIKNIEVAGDSTSLESNIGTVTIVYDRGNFGYIDATGGGEVGQLVGINGTSFRGITGATYSVGGATGAINSGLNVGLKSYREKSKYLIVGPNSAGTGDFWNDHVGVPTYELNINPNQAKVFELDLMQETSSTIIDWTVSGPTGPFAPIEFNDALFGYTGNGPATSNKIGKAFTLIVNGATYGNQNNYQFTNTIWPFDKQPCFSGGIDIFNFFWLPCDARTVVFGDGDNIEVCPNGYAWHGNVVQWKSPDTEIVAGKTGSDPFFCYDRYVSWGEPLKYGEGQVDYPGHERKPFGVTGATGACCRGEGECIHTISGLCRGYFHGSGTTCGVTSGSTGSICTEQYGSCCVYYDTSNTIECFDDFTTDECLSLGRINHVETTFGGISGECKNMDCGNAKENVGACCDGRGRCREVTKIDCDYSGDFFLGIGHKCVLEDKTNVCSGGTGACCSSVDNLCNNGISGYTCINGGDFYAGHGTICEDNICGGHNKELIGKSSSVMSLNLQPGDEYAGGIVVGLYRPYGSQLFGTSSFGKDKNAPWKELMVGGTGDLTDNLGLTCDFYKSKYDYHGYGFTSGIGCSSYNSLDLHDDMSRPDAYYIVVSPSPIAITGDREVVNIQDVPGATQDFYWSHKGSSWGPLYEPSTGLVSPISDDDIKGTLFGFPDYPGALPTAHPLQEGYWYNKTLGPDSLNVLGSRTFPTCKNARRLGSGHTEKLLSKSLQSAHGLWNRNWGLYNTVRMVGSDNILHQSISGDAAAGIDETPAAAASALTGGGPVIASYRATRLLDDNLINITGTTGANIPEVSSWYLPSQDEMSFIAANCIGDDDVRPYKRDLNLALIGHGAVPIQGWHWTSTGAFNETNVGNTGGTSWGDGAAGGVIVEGGNTAMPGSCAWAMKFDANGDESNFRTGKKNRINNKYKVRPIRMIRCDGQYATGGQSNQKLWTIPKVLRDSDKDINQ